MKKSFRALTLLCGFLIMVALLYQAIANFTFAPANYPSEPPFDAMALELTQYLSGHADSLSILFTEREAAHMVDVLNLFQLGKWVSILAAILSLLILPAAFKILGAPAWIRHLRIGMGLFFLFLAALAIWAMIDFVGWFVFMHKVAFSNDLWLLDPKESMLIQMLPVDFFMRAVRSIVFRFLINVACAGIGTVLIKKYSKGSAP